MSLTIAAHDDKDIAVGSESMGVVEDHGQLLKRLDHDKVFITNDHTALLLAGDNFDWWVVGQFIRDFTYVVGKQNLQEFDQIFPILGDMGNEALTFPTDSTELIFTLAGYNKRQPVIKAVRLHSGESPATRSPVAGQSFLTAGYTNCTQRADELLTEVNFTSEMPTSELEEDVRSVVDQCKDEFDQLLGGDTVVRVIKRSP